MGMEAPKFKMWSNLRFCGLTGYTDKAEIWHDRARTLQVWYCMANLALIGEGEMDTGSQSIDSAVSLRQTNVYRNLTFLPRDAAMLVRS